MPWAIKVAHGSCMDIYGYTTLTVSSSVPKSSTEKFTPVEELQMESLSCEGVGMESLIAFCKLIIASDSLALQEVRMNATKIRGSNFMVFGG